MRRYTNAIALFFVTVLTGFSIWVVWPDMPERYLPDFVPWPSGTGLNIGDFERESMRLGLDLKGGTRVLLEADARGGASNLDEALEGAETIIRRRVDSFGVSEAEVQRQGANRISVQLPGVSREEASELIGKTAELEFRQPRLDEARNVICQTADSGTITVPAQTGRLNIDDQGNANCLDTSGQTIGQIIWDPATGEGNDGTQKPLTGRYLTSAEAGFDPLGQPLIAIEFDNEGGNLFEDITGSLVGYPLGIFVDGVLISAPQVNGRISGGQGQITGVGLDEARTLSAQLNAGALPVPLNPIQIQEVDATLGDDAVRKSIQAGIVGILIVMLFIVVYYRLPGALASFALVTYTATILMVFKLWPVTLSLAGIAAFVLSVGMAVDANILVFERMKEELRGGRSLVVAIETGFNRAWSSIRDSNVATLITCGILYWFGDQFNANQVKGFAITLAIGVLISMFSAVVVSRTLMRGWISTGLLRRPWWFGVDREQMEAAAAGTGPRRRFRPAFDFIGKRGLFYLISLAIMVPGLISLAIPPALKPGIEFTSGSTFGVRFQQEVSQEDLRSELADLGHTEARVQSASDGTFVIRTDELEGTNLAPPLGPAPPSEREAMEDGLIERFGPLVDSEGAVVNRFLNFESISASVSRDIGRNATIAVIVASTAILFYITWAFRHLPNPFVYGGAAIIALLHDVGITIGLFSIFGKAFDAEVNTMFITALLTVIGFSVHDTIVVFDRIRENRTRNPNLELGEAVNMSLTETLSRSIGTSLTVMFTILAMLFLGGSTIRDFLLVLLVGIISGTYSSIFVASQLLVTWDSGFFSHIRRRLPKMGSESEARPSGPAGPEASVVR